MPRVGRWSSLPQQRLTHPGDDDRGGNRDSDNESQRHRVTLHDPTQQFRRAAYDALKSILKHPAVPASGANAGTGTSCGTRVGDQPMSLAATSSD